jgi:hypothetical protein
MSLTVKIDTREKIKLVFPKRIHIFKNIKSRTPELVEIKTQLVTLPQGDYTIAGYESLVGIERKGSVTEVMTNLMSTDRIRALSAYGRFAKAVKHPILLLDFNVNSFFPTLANPANILYYQTYQELCQVSTSLGIEMWHTGTHNTPKSRLTLGYAILYKLISYITQTKENIQHVKQTKEALCKIEEESVDEKPSVQ